MSVNGERRYVVGVEGEALTGVHLTVRRGRGTLRGVVHYSPTDEETIFRDWPKLSLAMGDRVEIVCSDDAATAPESEKSSRNNPRIAIRDAKLAARVHRLVAKFDRDLQALIRPVEKKELPDDARNFRGAVGRVLVTLFEHVYQPLWDAHPSLQPDGWRRPTRGEFDDTK